MIDHGFKYNMNITYLQRYCLNTIVTEYYGFCASLCQQSKYYMYVRAKTTECIISVPGTPSKQ